MAAVTLTAAQISVVDPSKCEIHPFVAGATITAGQLVALNSSGLAVPADADGAGTLPQARGVALNGGGTGQAISVLKRGFCAGFTLSGAYGSKLYISATAGELADASAATLAAVGQVLPASDSTATKLAYFNFDWTAGY